MGDFVGFEPITWKDFTSDIIAIALDGKGAQLAIGLSDGTVLLRDVATGEVIVRLQQNGCPVTALAFAPDGARLVSLDANGTIHVWETKGNGAWELARTIALKPAIVGLIPSAAFPFFIPQIDVLTISSIAISPDGKHLGATLDSSHFATVIALWNLTDGTRTTHSFSGRGSERFEGLAFSPDGKFLAAGYGRSNSAGVLLWRLDTGRVEHDLSLDPPSVEKVVFSPDGRFLACACGKLVVLFDTSKFQRRLFIKTPAATSIDFLAGSPLLAISDSCLGGIKLWDVAANREMAVLRHVSQPKDYLHFNVVYSRDRNALVAASPRVIRTWNLAGNGEKLIVAGHDGAIADTAISPNGKLLASAGEDNAVRIWDAATGKLRNQLSGFCPQGCPVAFSPDGSMLATDILIWDVNSWDRLAAPTDDELHAIISVAFSPDGRYFAACGERGGVTLWRIKRGGVDHGGDSRPSPERIARPPAHGMVWSLAFSPDSQFLAWVENEQYGSPQTIVRLWDVANSREQPFPPVRLAEEVKGIAFHSESKHLIFVADTGAAEAWDVTKGRKVFSFAAGNSEARSGITSLGGIIALSPDGAWLASSHGTFVTVWDMSRRQLLLKLPEEPTRSASIAWSRTGEFLAVGTSDGGLVIWNLVKIKAQLDEIGLGW
jgi:WD40 repeat protein